MYFAGFNKFTFTSVVISDYKNLRNVINFVIVQALVNAVMLFIVNHNFEFFTNSCSLPGFDV